jgi:hypothetical protein
MKIAFSIFILIAVASLPAFAQQSVPQDPLLDHVTGNWILQGTVAGSETTHDIEGEWVLGHEYLRLHETSREKNARGQSAYEAIIFIEWDASSSEYRCLWLDSTGGGGLSSPQAIAHGKRSGDEITFLFKDNDGSVHTTFAYSKATDTWQWLIDNEAGGKLSEFARLKLTRK